MVMRILEDHPNSPIGMIFDAKGDTFRHDMYKEYKAKEMYGLRQTEYEEGRRNVQDLQLPSLHPGCSNPLGCTGDLYRRRHRLNLERNRLPDGLVELV